MAKTDINLNSEEKFKALVEASADCIKLFDLEGNLLYINPGGLAEHRLKSLEEALGKKWQAIETVVTEDQPKFVQALKDAAQGKTTTIEIRHTKEGANREACSEIVAPVKNADGQIVAVFGISRDITDIKKRERAHATGTEKELQAKIRELEKTNESMVGRELKMVQLKKEILELKSQLNKLTK